MPIKIVVSEILLPSKISDLGRNREMSNTKLASLKNLSQLTENLVSERFYIDWEIANNYFPRPAILNPKVNAKITPKGIYIIIPLIKLTKLAMPYNPIPFIIPHNKS